MWAFCRVDIEHYVDITGQVKPISNPVDGYPVGYLFIFLAPRLSLRERRAG